MKKQVNRKNTIAITLVCILAIAVGCFAYINDYYRALSEALEVVSDPIEGITVTEKKNDQIVFAPESTEVGLIFYPGGHSLGGSMAASYAAKNTEELDGVILLASYSTAALQDSGLEVVSIYGSNDKVLNLEKYDKYRGNLPEDFKEEVIEGGNHAYFGKYGSQEGDGEAAITNENQIKGTADIVAAEILE